MKQTVGSSFSTIPIRNPVGRAILEGKHNEQNVIEMLAEHVEQRMNKRPSQMQNCAILIQIVSLPIWKLGGM